MLACETWLANDFLTRRGYKPGPCCGHDPDACPPHREEQPMPDPTTLPEWVEHCRQQATAWRAYAERARLNAAERARPPATSGPDMCQTADEHGRPLCVRQLRQRPCATCPDAPPAATDLTETHTRRAWVAALRFGARRLAERGRYGPGVAVDDLADMIERGELTPWRTDAPPAAPAPPETAAQPDPGTVAPPERQGAAGIPALVAMPDLTDRERADFLAAAAELDGEPAPLDLDAIERMTHDSHDPIMAMQARHLIAEVRRLERIIAETDSLTEVERDRAMAELRAADGQVDRLVEETRHLAAGIAAVLDSVDRAEAAHIRIRQGTEDVCAACSDAWVQQVWPCPTALLAGAVRRHLATVPALTANQSTTEETGHV